MIVAAIVAVFVAVFGAVHRVAGWYGNVIAGWNELRKGINEKRAGGVTDDSMDRPLAIDPFPEMAPEQAAEWVACLQGGRVEGRNIECGVRGHSWTPGVLYCVHCGLPREPLAAASYALAFDEGYMLDYADREDFRQLCRDRARVVVEAYNEAVRLAGASPVEVVAARSVPVSGTAYEAAVLRLIAGSVTLTDHERRSIAVLLVALGERAESGSLDQVLEKAFWNAIEALRAETLDMAIIGRTAHGSLPAGRRTLNGTQHRSPRADADQRPET